MSVEKNSMIKSIDLLKSNTNDKKLDLEHFMTAFRLLMPEEQEILRILSNTNSPISSRRIRKEISVNEISNQLLDIIDKVPQVADLLEIDVKKIKKGFNPEDIRGSFENILEERKLNSSNVRSILLRTTDRELEKVISKFNSFTSKKIPSQDKVDSTLRSLESLDLVTKRELIESNATRVWSLTIWFALKFLTIKNYLNERNQKTPTEFEKHSYRIVQGIVDENTIQ